MVRMVRMAKVFGSCQSFGFSLGTEFGFGIVWGFFLFCLGFFRFAVLGAFLPICSMLKPEAAMSTICSTFWLWNLSLPMVFARF